jgi:uracil-xanthine permease
MAEAGSDPSAEKMNGCDVCAVKCWTPEGCFGFGKYNWSFLCMPQAPCLKKVNPPMFLGKDEKLPLLLSASMGLQHMLAMCVGIATSGGMLHANEACWSFNYDSLMCGSQSFLVSCAWMASGFLTMIQVFRCKIYKTPFYLGTGLVSVMGTSFTFLPIGQAMVSSSIAEAKAAGDSRCLADQPYKGGPQTTMDCKGVAVEAYGKFLGTAMIASLLELVVGFTWKTKITKMFFPPVVVGMAVMMIGCALIASGIKYLGGGVFCGENMVSFTPTMMDHGFNYARKKGTIKCNENGGVLMQFGAPEYVLMGSGVVAFGTILQIFGSPFLKSTFIFWSLMFGVIVSAIAEKNGSSYWNLGPGSAYDNAKPFVFLWSQTTFPIGFDGAYFLPILICYWVTAAETYGDVQMTAYYSRVYTPGDDGKPTNEADEKELDSRIQGGLLADGVNSFLACLFGSPPNTTFSQNNGVIALTRCASRSAGFSCGIWLILFGMFGKIGGFFASIPICVVGGIVLQCFCMVFVAGLGMLADAGVGKENNRRSSYIAMVAIAFGVGVALEPQIFDAGVTSPSAFYHTTLGFNYGLWPKYMVCDSPVLRTITTPSSCAIDGGSTLKGGTAADCTVLGGTFTASSTLETGLYCSDYFGQNIIRCCGGWNKGLKSLRTAVIVVLKTPYCIAPLIALLLHAIIPYDRAVEEEPAPKQVNSA